MKRNPQLLGNLEDERMFVSAAKRILTGDKRKKLSINTKLFFSGEHSIYSGPNNKTLLN